MSINLSSMIQQSNVKNIISQLNGHVNRCFRKSAIFKFLDGGQISRDVALLDNDKRHKSDTHERLVQSTSL